MIDKKSMSVLIVDDIESMARSIRGMLRVIKYGKNILTASNGRKGWDAINNTQIDLAIIDWTMPVMPGNELLALIRSSKEYRDMIVIMITAAAEKSFVAEMAEQDIDGYLLKPLTTNTLDEKISSVIKLANDPEPSTLHFLKARTLEEDDNNIQGAIDEVVKALKLKPDSSRFLRKLGQLYTILGVDKTAEKCLRKAVAVNPNDAMSRYILGELYLAKDDLLQALRFFDEAIKISPRNISKGIELGEKLMKRGLRTHAIDIFQKVLKHSDKNLMCTEDVVKKCLLNGEINFAKKLIIKMLKDNPERLDLRMTLGDIYYKMGDINSALENYNKLEALAPENLQTKLKLAKIYVAQKKVMLAERYLDDVLKLDPTNIEATTLRQQNI